MLKRFLHILPIAALLTGLASCTREPMLEIGKDVSSEDERPVEFRMSLPDAKTRGIDNPKIAFVEGDLIHVEGTFAMDDGTTVVRYGALNYDKDGKWNAVEGSGLTWPNRAASGKFVAYYVATGEGYKGGLLSSSGNADGNAVEVRLENLKSDGDPLKAETSGSVGYGHAVALKFKHLCTYLTLNYLEPMVATNYWFTRRAKEGMTFNNAFRLKLVDENGEKKLKFEFCQLPDNNYPQLGSAQEGLVYISGAVSNFEVDGGVGTRTKYFLEPGLYDDFSLVYNLNENTYVEYLRYDYNRIPESEDHKKTEPRFEAGIPYTLDINKSAGVEITTPSEGNKKWDEGDVYYDVDVEQFLRAVRNSEDYYYKEAGKNDVLVLQKTATGTQLLYNVDFKFAQYDLFKDNFEPNTNGGQIFDGGYHYIRNLGCPLFSLNYGTVQNLGIKTINFTAGDSDGLVSEEDAVSESGKNFDKSRTGGVCRRNMETGIISNVRISDGVDIVVQVKSKKSGDKDNNGNTQGNEAHSVGGVAGSNIGVIKNVELADKFNVTVTNHAEAKADLFVQLNVGGIVGQNGANGSIAGVNPIDGNLEVQVINECSGSLAAFYMGGITGSNSGYLSDIVVPNLDIDGTKSYGLTSYIGGVAGDLSAAVPVSVGSGFKYAAAVSSCIVSGTVSGGNVTPNGDLTCAILAGGVAGATLHTPVSDCSAAVSVNNSTVDLTRIGIICATGGAFGRIRKEGSDIPPITDIIAYGDDIKFAATAGSTSYVGNFAGLVPEGMTWDTNFAGNNIIVNNHTGVSEAVGGTIE